MNDYELIGMVLAFASMCYLAHLGFKTTSPYAHLLAYVSGMLLVGEMANVGLNFFITIPVGVLATYSAVQVIVLKMSNKWKHKRNKK